MQPRDTGWPKRSKYNCETTYGEISEVEKIKLNCGLFFTATHAISYRWVHHELVSIWQILLVISLLLFICSSVINKIGFKRSLQCMQLHCICAQSLRRSSPSILVSWFEVFLVFGLKGYLLNISRTLTFWTKNITLLITRPHRQTDKDEN